MADISPVTQRNAEWAETFGSATTSLSQRHRYAQDRMQYATELVDAREAELQRRRARDSGERDLYFRQENLERQNKESEFRMKLQEEAHNWKKQMFPKELELKAAAIRAAELREEAMIETDRLKTEAKAEENGAIKTFLGRVREARGKGLKMLTPEYAEFLADERLNNPSLPTQYFDDLWNTTSGSRVSPEEAITQAVEKKKRLMALEPAKPAKEPKPDSYEQFNNDLAAAKTAYSNGLPDFIQRAFEARGKALEAQTTGAQPSQTSSIPELTTKAQFDALPSGAVYVRNGKRFQKP